MSKKEKGIQDEKQLYEDLFFDEDAELTSDYQPHQSYEDIRITETKIFTVCKKGLPCVQFILNFFENHKVTVKMFMPYYPGEHSFYWVRERYGTENVHEIREKIHNYIKERNADIVYWGF